MEREDSKDNFTYNWKNPEKTVKKLYDAGYSVGEIAADMADLDWINRGDEMDYVKKVLGK